jgi:hypothetical protein
MEHSLPYLTLFSPDFGQTKAGEYQKMLAVQIDTPMCTVEEFARRSGIPEKTIRNKIFKGEIPTIKTNLQHTPAGAVYVNLLALVSLCSEGGKHA